MRNLCNVWKSVKVLCVCACVCVRACVSVGNGNAQMHLIFLFGGTSLQVVLTCYYMARQTLCKWIMSKEHTKAHQHNH